jgi:uncharacterized membrane protein
MTAEEPTQPASGQPAHVPYASKVRHETLALRRARTAQDRAADGITRFAGSMSFVYLHIGWFAFWILLNVGLLGSALVFDDFPFGLLTLVVSLEAIFLSTFVMISQNRESSRADIRAQLDFETNLRAEVLVYAIAKHTGVDLAKVNATIDTEIARTRSELASGGGSPAYSQVD